MPDKTLVFPIGAAATVTAPCGLGNCAFGIADDTAHRFIVVANDSGSREVQLIAWFNASATIQSSVSLGVQAYPSNDDAFVVATASGASPVKLTVEIPAGTYDFQVGKAAAPDVVIEGSGAVHVHGPVIRA